MGTRGYGWCGLSGDAVGLGVVGMGASGTGVLRPDVPSGVALGMAVCTEEGDRSCSVLDNTPSSD